MISYLIETMFMDLYLRVIDEENRLLPIRLLKVRTKCDATIRESIQNFLCGDSDDSEYELVDTPLLSKAKQFKVNHFFTKISLHFSLKCFCTGICLLVCLDIIQ